MGSESGTYKFPMGRTGAQITGQALLGASCAHGRPGARRTCIGIARGRYPAGYGGHNPWSRRAVCERHKYGSVRGAFSDEGPYSISTTTADGLRCASTSYASRFMAPCAVSRGTRSPMNLTDYWNDLAHGQPPIASRARSYGAVVYGPFTGSAH